MSKNLSPPTLTKENHENTGTQTTISKLIIKVHSSIHCNWSIFCAQENSTLGKCQHILLFLFLFKTFMESVCIKKKPILMNNTQTAKNQ